MSMRKEMMAMLTWVTMKCRMRCFTLEDRKIYEVDGREEEDEVVTLRVMAKWVRMATLRVAAWRSSTRNPFET